MGPPAQRQPKPSAYGVHVRFPERRGPNPRSAPDASLRLDTRGFHHAVALPAPAARRAGGLRTSQRGVAAARAPGAGGANPVAAGLPATPGALDGARGAA